jgi:hypothetical protein
MNLLKKAVLGAAVGAMALATAPADARGYYRHYHHDDAGVAIGAGILGLAVGAAIASSNNDRYYDGYYNYPYYNGYQYYTPGYNVYYYPYTYPYYDGYWYNGYRYNDGYFYDRRGYRAYDRDDWNRHYGRGGYRHHR